MAATRSSSVISGLPSFQDSRSTRYVCKNLADDQGGGEGLAAAAGRSSPSATPRASPASDQRPSGPSGSLPTSSSKPPCVITRSGSVAPARASPTAALASTPVPQERV